MQSLTQCLPDLICCYLHMTPSSRLPTAQPAVQNQSEAERLKACQACREHGRTRPPGERTPCPRPLTQPCNSTLCCAKHCSLLGLHLLPCSSLKATCALHLLQKAAAKAPSLQHSLLSSSSCALPCRLLWRDAAMGSWMPSTPLSSAWRLRSSARSTSSSAAVTFRCAWGNRGSTCTERVGALKSPIMSKSRPQLELRICCGDFKAKHFHVKDARSTLCALCSVRVLQQVFICCGNSRTSQPEVPGLQMDVNILCDAVDNSILHTLWRILVHDL